MKTRTAVVLWTLALVLASGAVFLTFTSDHEPNPVARAALAVSLGLAFVGSGLVATARRPENRTGILMTVVGFTWFAGSLAESDNAYLFTSGTALDIIPFAAYAHLVFAFPSGRLETRLARAGVVAAYAIATVWEWAWLSVEPRPAGPDCDCPENLLALAPDEGLASALLNGQRLAALGVLGLALLLLFRRRRDVTPAARRAISPALAAISISIVMIAALLVADTISGRAGETVYWALLVSWTAVPLTFLFGVLRSRLARTGVGRLLVEVPEAATLEEAQEGLRRALGDPTLRLAYWLPDEARYVDADGKPFDLPDDTASCVTTRIDADGAPVAALVHDAALRDEPELLEEVIAAARLGLEKDRSLTALRASEARNRALLDAIPDLMFRIARDGTYLDVNAQDESLLVAPASELIGKKVQDFLPEQAAAETRDAAQRALDGGGTETVDYRVVLGGEERHFEGRVTPSGRDEVLLIVRDITERTRQAELLERERDFIRTIVQTAPTLFAIVDADGRIVNYNAALEALSGHPDDDATRGRAFWDVFLAPDDADDFRRSLASLVAGRHVAEHEHEFLTRDGERRAVAWSGTDIVDAQGRQRYLFSGLDIAERKRQQEELRASRARLVQAGDAERRRLERNLHDGAQQHLVSLSLLLRLARAKLNTDEAAADELLTNAGEELAQALEDLRELARGIHPAVLTDRGLPAALEAVAARAPVPIEVDVPDERLPTPVEAAAYFVVSEALANVAKYAHASSVHVRVARDNGRVVVEVADDGVGGADPSAGSGLRGLADRIGALDGRLEITSASNAGTRIRAEIPVA